MTEKRLGRTMLLYSHCLWVNIEVPSSNKKLMKNNLSMGFFGQIAVRVNIVRKCLTRRKAMRKLLIATAVFLTMTSAVCADGYLRGGPGTYQQYGNTTYSPDGTTSRRYGNTMYNSDGTTSRQYGNTLYNSDGTTEQRYGDITYRSDGTVCRRYGNLTYCN